MKLSQPTTVYREDQVEAWLGAAAVDRGREYVRSVLDLAWHGNTLNGRVQGSGKRPYEVRVTLRQSRHGLQAESLCTCPVTIDCKHAAALLLAALPSTRTGTGARSEVVDWLEGFRARHGPSTGSATPGKAKAPKLIQAIAYVLTWSDHRDRFEARLFKARPNGAGGYHGFEAWSNVEAALVKPPKFVCDEDLAILQALWLGHKRGEDATGFALKGSHGAVALERMMATGRLFAAQKSTPLLGSRDPWFVIEPLTRDVSPVALRAGAPRAAEIIWETLEDGRVRPVLKPKPPAAALLGIDPAWYVDDSAGEAGLLELAWPAPAIADFLAMPPIEPGELPLVGAVLRDVAPDLPMPPLQGAPAAREVDVAPVPVLTLHTQTAYSWGWQAGGLNGGALDFATVSFDYGGMTIDAHARTTLCRDAGDDVVQVRRHFDEELERIAELRSAGFVKVPGDRYTSARPLPSHMYGPKSATDWPDLMQSCRPQLLSIGWRVVMTEGFRFNIIDVDDIVGAVRPSGEGWFDLEMGIKVGDRTVPLEPLLATLFERDSRWLSGELDRIADDEPIELKTDRGERLRLRAQRLKAVVRVLIDLFDNLGQGLRVHELDAGRLEALEHLGRWQFHGDASIRSLAQRLLAGSGMAESPVPRGLRADLRPYQVQGLAWMQFLRAQGLSGVLADDMGLGKTVQTLAHVLAEKEAGRLDRPALIVVPTTLVHNWGEESRRFAPDLQVLDLQGPGRWARFEQIPRHDLVLTTYALLWRDREALAKHRYHLLILDEAQYVKNAATKAAETIRELDARHRLCLTGTPLENHLGELWAQFDFLLPGFLGTQKDFSKRWRTPIEKGGDAVRRDLLARRVRPFMLRRRKDEVAKELPPKSVIVRTVELQGGQRDLYETVRTAMQEKVRAAISAQGLARSHLIVLDALLKLRQVCCDPRLVKLERAARVQESAKLELLMDMVPEMLDEGRRILLFSQFTGMLALIAAALDQAAIPYTMLTGDTTDRVTPVKRFSSGDVALMLISLKAGGVGLNLTAADTVIHYDPWWNPAAENQATDRAHRIGQDKPVFVYKLITAGSIEEKIVGLQQHKAALADAILSDDGANAHKFSPEDLQALFEPIPP